MLSDKTPGTYYVYETARSMIPKTIKVFKREPRSPNDFSIKWTKEYTVWKLKSVLPAAGYNKAMLEVVYEIADKT